MAGHDNRQLIEGETSTPFLHNGQLGASYLPAEDFGERVLF